MSTTTSFFGGEIRKISVVWVVKAPDLELCFTFNIKTIPRIRPLLDSTKGDLNRGILLYVVNGVDYIFRDNN